MDKVTQARTQNPTYSPDGKLLAYLYVSRFVGRLNMLILSIYSAMDRPGYEADRLHINIYDRKSGTTTPLTSKVASISPLESIPMLTLIPCSGIARWTAFCGRPTAPTW